MSASPKDDANPRLQAIRQMVEQTHYTDDQRRSALDEIQKRRSELYGLKLQMQQELVELQAIEAVHRAALGRPERDPTN